LASLPRTPSFQKISPRAPGSRNNRCWDPLPPPYRARDLRAAPAPVTHAKMLGPALISARTPPFKPILATQPPPLRPSANPATSARCRAPRRRGHVALPRHHPCQALTEFRPEPRLRLEPSILDHNLYGAGISPRTERR